MADAPAVELTPEVEEKKKKYLESTDIEQSKGRGRKLVLCCGIYIGARKETCEVCGADTRRNTTTSSGGSGGAPAANGGGKPKLPRKDVIKDFLTMLKLLDEAKQQEVTIEEFVDSIKINWDVLENVTTIKELKDLKSRKVFGSLIDKYGAAEVISCGKKIVEEQ